MENRPNSALIAKRVKNLEIKALGKNKTSMSSAKFLLQCTGIDKGNKHFLEMSITSGWYKRSSVFCPCPTPNVYQMSNIGEA